MNWLNGFCLAIILYSGLLSFIIAPIIRKQERRHHGCTDDPTLRCSHYVKEETK